jgi:tellurite resistance protein
MHEENKAVIKALVPVAWADGEFADKEKAMLDALLAAYGASQAESDELRSYAAEKRTLDDIELHDLSAADRRVVLAHAVLLTFVDGNQADDEKAMLDSLAAKLKIPAEEAKQIVDQGTVRAQRYLNLL